MQLAASVLDTMQALRNNASQLVRYNSTDWGQILPDQTASVRIGRVDRNSCREASVNWQVLGLVSGATLLGVAGLQALGAVVAARRRARASQTHCEARQLEFDRQLAKELQWARASKPIFKAWEGIRPFQVTAVVDEAIDCKSFYLVPTDGHPLPRFEPGQFLTLNLPIDPRKKPLVRCYSLSDSCDDFQS